MMKQQTPEVDWGYLLINKKQTKKTKKNNNNNKKNKKKNIYLINIEISFVKQEKEKESKKNIQNH